MLHNVAVTEDEEDLSRLYRAIGDATRRRIIDELAAREHQALFELFTRVVLEHQAPLSRQAFSRHLAVLEEVGLIAVEWKGTTKLHSLNPGPLARLPDGWLSKFRKFK